MSQFDHQQAVARLEAWAAERARQGKRAPASPQRPDLLSLHTVEAETGISRLRFNRPHQRLRQLLERLVERLGGLELEWDKESFETGEVHLQLARALCMKHYERECAEAGDYFEPCRLALERLFLMAAKRSRAGLAAPARPALVELAASIGAGAVRNGEPLRPYVETALALVAKEEQRTGLPEAFPDRLCLLVARAGLSRSQAAASIGVVQGTFNSWCTGIKAPDKSFWPKIAELESLLGLETGTLLDVIAPRRPGAGRIDKGLFPPALRGEDQARRRAEIARQMPEDFFDRPIAEQMHLLALTAERLDEDASHRRGWYELRQSSYALAPFPAALEVEWQDLLAFKEGRSQLEGDDGRPVAVDKLWRKRSTVVTNQVRIAQYLGFLVGHAPEPLRIEREAASLLQLSDAAALLGFLRFKQQRQSQFTGSARITKTDLDLLTLGAALLSPQDGFLRLDKRFEAGLLALRGRFGMLAPPADLPEAERRRRDDQDRHDICNRLLDDIKRIERSFRGRTSNSATHRARLEPLLSQEAPLQQFYERLAVLDAELERLDPARIGYWRAVRSLALLHILAQFPARRSMLVELDYRPDNSGHLRFADEKWFFIIPVAMFKNDLAQHFSGLDEVKIPIDDVHGAYAAIGRYVEAGRQRILRGARSDAIFVSSRDNPRYSPQGIDNLFQALLSRLLGPGGGAPLHLADGFIMTIHGMRDLVATSALKASGDFQTAADAILDSESTVRKAYARYLPADRSPRLKEALRAARGLGSGGDCLGEDDPEGDDHDHADTPSDEDGEKAAIDTEDDDEEGED